MSAAEGGDKNQTQKAAVKEGKDDNQSKTVNNIWGSLVDHDEMVKTQQLSETSKFAAKTSSLSTIAYKDDGIEEVIG